MTPLELQDELIAELKLIYEETLFPAPDGERVPLNVYAQRIPIPEDEDAASPVPYAIVRLNSGHDEGTRDSFNDVSVLVIFGMWDEGVEAQGYKSVMNCIQELYERFHKNPNLRGRAMYRGGFDWAMQEDEYYPYFFGACTMTFAIAAIRREDRWA